MEAEHRLENEKQVERQKELKNLEDDIHKIKINQQELQNKENERDRCEEDIKRLEIKQNGNCWLPISHLPHKVFKSLSFLLGFCL